MISVQPKLVAENSIEQWDYYERQIINHLTKEKNQNSFNDGVPTIVSLPEYALGNEKRTNKKVPIDNLLERISIFSKNYKIITISGSFAYNDTKGYKNNLFIINSDGKFIGNYEKKYLFNFEKKNGFIPGDTPSLFQLEIGLNIKVLICSDLWYPEEIRKDLNNIDLLVVPAMTVVPNEERIEYGRWLWHSLAITRSRENVLPLLVSDWAVQPIGDSWTCGSSAILDPSVRWSSKSEYKQAFNCITDGNEGVISSLINLKKVEEYRSYRKDVGLLPI